MTKDPVVVVRYCWLTEKGKEILEKIEKLKEKEGSQ